MFSSSDSTPAAVTNNTTSTTTIDTKKIGNYEIGRLIGDGRNVSLTKVRLALDRNTKEPYAIKIIDKKRGLIPLVVSNHHQSSSSATSLLDGKDDANSSKWKNKKDEDVKKGITSASAGLFDNKNSSSSATKENNIPSPSEFSKSLLSNNNNNDSDSLSAINTKTTKICPIHSITCKKDIAAAKHIRHKYVVNLKEVLETSANVYFVTELVTGGELFDRLVLTPEQVSKVRSFLRRSGGSSSSSTKLIKNSSASATTGGASSSNEVLLEDEDIRKLLKDVIIPEEALQYYEEAGSNGAGGNNKAVIGAGASVGGINSSAIGNGGNPTSTATASLIIEDYLGPNSSNINNNRGPSAYPRFREDAARKYFQQLVAAIRFCHQNGIYHKNLKPENLLLDREGRLKISDMNLTSVRTKYFWGVKDGAASAHANKGKNGSRQNKNDEDDYDDDEDEDENEQEKQRMVRSGKKLTENTDEFGFEQPSSSASLTTTSLSRVLEDKAKLRDSHNKKVIKSVLQSVGNLHFAAPEIVLQKGYSSNISDVWSCGAILYLMLAGHNAFDDPDPKVLIKKIERGQYFMSPNIPDGAKDLIKKILVVEPARRVSMNDVVAHPWFQTNFDPAEFEHGVMLSSSGQSASSSPQQQHKLTKNQQQQQDPSSSGADQTTSGKNLLNQQSAAGGDATEGANDDQKEKEKNQEYIKLGEDAFMIARKLMLASLVSSPRVEAVAARAAQEAAKESGQATSSGGASFSPTAALRYVLLRVHFDKVSKTMADILSQIMPHFQRPAEGSLEFRGYVQAKNSLLTFLIVISRTVVPSLTLCEIRKGRGDFFDFIEFVSAIINALGSGRVASQEMIIRTPGK